ncbi:MULTISPECIES: RsmB/NOP family class I SAM-dependent RNA methyltransferase [Acetobacter]|uniref:Methyltransferase domain-containing protein n=2 Tax=Acetobacter TaxID=434 RepID=A0A5B9GFF9_9PROT|nr:MULTISPECIES: transcription antitermination factor NusB [Acetobacter]GBR57205.1 tRNA/rRNA cytosine-C5-methylase Nol1/Nop2/Sun [Acetobacter senegalensis DSM 18889]AKR48912.1 rRNA cytosine-C5-methylase [Acetobacter pasteurianus]ARW46721.1 16S rRNA (cytosine(967)-C(5))-methyltransferase [Acetobacter pasteurianus subsp. pasteurianus]MCP1201560.1 methyltransferase domain-containing protein [Acetobacter oryzoeni]QEE84921.1 methyltransferase domain-containing protein [Acetobacter oryzoeni]
MNTPARAPRSPKRGKGRPAPPQPDPTRDIAFDILCGVVEHRRMLENSLSRSAEAHKAEPRDRAAAHRLAAATLRHMGTLRTVLEPFLRKEPPEPVRVALMIGCAQLLFLETPPHAAVGTTVSLLRRRKLAPFAGLANAVLRKVAAEGQNVLEGLDQARLNIPAWLWSSWSVLGRGVPRAIAEGISHEAPLDITLRPGATAPEGGSVLPNGSVRYPAGTRVADLAGYEEGAFWVQDAAATLPARLLNVKEGEKVADLCAAPGGKTAQLAVTGAQVAAIENNPNRMARLKENMARLGLGNVATLQADAGTWQPDAPLDAILLDAPCSATGTARRHPDVLWVKRPRDLTTLTAGQDRLLEAAKNMLRPGGRLVYAVCSLQQEEGPDRARAAEAMGLVPDPFTPEELAFLPEARTPEGWLRTHPGMWADKGSMDGFFAARFIRP